MEDELLLSIYHYLFPSPSANPCAFCMYGDAIVVLIHLYAALRDRSDWWAWDKRNWPLWARRLKFPSYSQLMRRLKTPEALRLIEKLNKEQTAAIDAFEVTSLNIGEPTTAQRLVRQLDLKHRTLRTDSNYDSNPFYAVVSQQGGRLIAPRKKPYTSLGHHRQHPDRIRAIRELESSELVLEHHQRHRIRVEQGLAQLTNISFGLAPLPNFVRRLHRVRRWVAAKILLYHAYLSLRRKNAEAA